MKKTAALSIKFLILLAAFLPVMSCGFDEEEGDATYPYELLGMWQAATADVTVTVDGGTPQQSSEQIDDKRISINGNSTLMYFEFDEIASEWVQKERCFWKYNKEKLLVKNSENEQTLFNVVSLSNQRLVLSCVEEETTEDGKKELTETTVTFFRTMETM